MEGRGGVGSRPPDPESARRVLAGYSEAAEPEFHSELDELRRVLTEATEGSLVEIIAHQRYLKPDRARRPVFRVGAAESGEDGSELTLQLEADSQRYDVRMEIEPELARPTARCLDAPRELFVGEVVEIEAARLIDASVRWPVLRRSGGTRVYHRPDPVALAYDRVRPACVATPSTDAEAEYRLTSSDTLSGHFDPCIECFRAPRTLGFDTFDCSECGISLARFILQGPKVKAVTEICVECPRCGHQSKIKLD